MTHTKPDNEKPVITDWILWLAYLGTFATMALVGWGVLEVFDLIWWMSDTFRSWVLMGLLLLVLFRSGVSLGLERSTYSKLARRFVLRDHWNILADCWFNVPAAAALITFFSGAFYRDYVSISPLIIYSILLVGLGCNLIFVGMPISLGIILGFVDVKITKLTKLLEENDGRICLSCQYVLIAKDETDPKCPECGAVDERWLYKEIAL